MDTRLLLFKVLSETGACIPEEAVGINVYSSEIYFTDEDESYIRGTSIYFDNPQVGYDTYTISLEGPSDFTVKEFEEWKVEHQQEILEFENNLRGAMVVIAGLVDGVQNDIQRGIDLATKYGLPFEINLNGSCFDLRKIEAVDWNSSSMYC